MLNGATCPLIGQNLDSTEIKLYHPSEWLRKLYEDNIDRLINDKHGSKVWWCLIKIYTKGKSSLSTVPPIFINDKLYDDNTEIANIINEYFTNQTKVSYPGRNIQEVVSYTDNSLSDVYLNQNEVYDILYSVDTTKAIGPDGISKMFLKMNSRFLAAPLTDVFNQSLSENTFPQVRKEASVVPIHKRASINDCSNYRPVALTSCLAKIFEKCVFKHVLNYFRDNDLFSHIQSGFKPGDSSVNQLTYLYDFIAGALDKGK